MFTGISVGEREHIYELEDKGFFYLIRSCAFEKKEYDIGLKANCREFDKGCKWNFSSHYRTGAIFYNIVFHLRKVPNLWRKITWAANLRGYHLGKQGYFYAQSMQEIIEREKTNVSKKV